MERGTNHEALGKNNTHSCLHLRNVYNLWYDVYRRRNYLKNLLTNIPKPVIIKIQKQKGIDYYEMCPGADGYCRR